jgi:hypothetical protein
MRAMQVQMYAARAGSVRAAIQFNLGVRRHVTVMELGGRGSEPAPKGGCFPPDPQS